MQSRLVLSTALSTRRARRVPLILAVVAVSHVLGGISCLVCHQMSPLRVEFRATAGVLLLLLGVAQLAVAARVRRRQLDGAEITPLRVRLFARWLLVGFVVCYGASMLTGPSSGSAYVLITTLSCWYTAATLPLYAAPGSLDRLLDWLRWRPLRIVGWTLYGLLLTPLFAELVLRGYNLAGGDTLNDAFLASQLRLAPGSTIAGRKVNSQGYLDEEFVAPAKPGLCRIAAVGNGIPLEGSAQTNVLERIERRLPGIEIYNFGLPGIAPREVAAQVKRDVGKYSPDVLLAFVSVGRDITRARTAPGYFDYRGLKTVQLGSRWLGLDGQATARTIVETPMDRTTYLRHCAQKIKVCRTPLDAQMRDQWQIVFDDLRTLVDSCRRQNVSLALVVTPSEFQLNPVLCRTVARRAGYGAEELDLELPQRRFISFARECEIPVLDLLPHLRAAGPSVFNRHTDTFNDQGQALVADVLDHWIQSHFGSLIATVAQVQR